LCGAHIPWNATGIIFWDNGGSTLGASRVKSDTAPTVGDDNWAFTCGTTGGPMSIWQNGIRIGHDATAARTRAADSGNNLRLGGHNAWASDIGVWRHFMVFNRVLNDSELELLGRDPMAMFEPSIGAMIAAGTEHLKSESHTLGISDSETHVVEYLRSESHTLGVSDSVIVNADFGRSRSHTLGLTDVGDYAEDILESVSHALSISDAVIKDLEHTAISKPPLIIKDGKIQQLGVGDLLLEYPVELIFTYSGGNLETINNGVGIKTFAYSGGKLSTISDTETGKISTFNYTGDDLTSITITDI
jgi:hypothetical protein